MRFANNMHDFNNPEVAFLPYPRRRSVEMTSPQKQIVDVLSWSLLPNHFHLLVQDKVEKGRSLFSRKLTIGYTMYVNPRRQRSGTLFQGRTKVIPVIREAHFLHLPFYVLANPLDLFQFGWKEEGIHNPQKAVEFLKSYRWCAFSDLVGKNNFPHVINKSLFFDLFDTDEKRLQKDFLEWLDSYARDPDFPKFLR